MKKRIAMLLFSHYLDDPRPRREAEALVSAGMRVDVICLRGDDDQLHEENFHGVNIYRIKLQQKRGSKLRYLWEYIYFIVAAFFKLTWMHHINRYDVIHVHNMPDILITSALFPKITGSKIVLDLHDPMPELFSAIYSASESHPIIRLLKIFEKLSIRLANLVITPNIAFRELFISRGCPANKIHIIMNSPQENIFISDISDIKDNRETEKISDNLFSLMYHGFITDRNGIDTAIKAVTRIRNKIPNFVFHIYGTGNFVSQMEKLIIDFNVSDIIKYHGGVSIEEIASALKEIDVGVIPNKFNPFTQLNFPTRIFECLAMGKPVIAPRTKGILQYFDEQSLFFFDPGNVEDLSRAILQAYSNPEQRTEKLEKGINIYQKYRWSLQEKQLVELIRVL